MAAGGGGGALLTGGGVGDALLLVPVVFSAGRYGDRLLDISGLDVFLLGLAALRGGLRLGERAAAERFGGVREREEYEADRVGLRPRATRFGGVVERPRRRGGGDADLEEACDGEREVE